MNTQMKYINSISTVPFLWLILSLSALPAGNVARALSCAQQLKISHLSPRWYGGGRRPRIFLIYSAYSGSTCSSYWPWAFLLAPGLPTGPGPSYCGGIEWVCRTVGQGTRQKRSVAGGSQEGKGNTQKETRKGPVRDP
jgi:hypothetical protein